MQNEDHTRNCTSQLAPECVFQAKDGAGQPVQATWHLDPDIGTLTTVESPGASSSYLAPTSLSVAESIVVVASTAKESAYATINLTPERVAIFLNKVQLKGGGSQQFTTIVAGTQAGSVSVSKWLLTPNIGTIDEQTGFYRAPDTVEDADTVTVSAILSEKPEASQRDC